MNSRSPYTTGACMGLPATWRISDLSPSYVFAPVQILNAVSGNVTSTAYAADSNSIEVQTVFSDGATSCTITLLVDDGTNTGTFVTFATRTNVNALKGNLFFGFLDDNKSLMGRPIKLQVSNYTGTGTITANFIRLN